MKTGIIIPCFNESKRLDTKSFTEFIMSNDNYHLCFVNDGSSDDTFEELRRMKIICGDRISIFNMLNNRGKAAAVQNGAKYLYNREDIKYIGFMDADLSTSFKDFDKLVTTLKTNDDLVMVYGSRRKGDQENIDRSFFRDFFSRIIKVFIYMILRLPIEDTQCGAKVFTKESVPIAYKNRFLSKWLFDVEIFIRFKKHFGLKEVMSKIHEQPLEEWNDVDGSKLGMKDAVVIPFKLLSIWYSYTFTPEELSEQNYTSLQF